MICNRIRVVSVRPRGEDLMEVGKTIKELRMDAGMSQDELAGKVFVSRQTISNWENGKFYPDVQSLSIIADIFGTSIDSLVKGDLPMMETRITEQDTRSLKRDAVIYTALLAIALVVMLVAFSLENWLALAAGALTYVVAMYAIVALKIRYELRTYSEIVSFCNGASLDEIKAKRESELLGAGIMMRVVVAGCAGIVIGVAAALLVQVLS